MLYMQFTFKRNDCWKGSIFCWKNKDFEFINKQTNSFRVPLWIWHPTLYNFSHLHVQSLLDKIKKMVYLSKMGYQTNQKWDIKLKMGYQIENGILN